MLYFIQEEKSTNIKIGYTGSAAEQRQRDFQTGNSDKLCVLLMIDGTKADECALHRRFSEYRICGEWFKPSSAILQYIIGHKDNSVNVAIENCPNWIGSKVASRHSIKCPICDFDYVHHEPVILADVGLNYRALSFSCESGHHWSLWFEFHEGQMFVEWGFDKLEKYATCT